MDIYTKTGDDGSTGLLYGGRVSKDDLRTEAYGTTDEAVAALGLARSLEPISAEVAEIILRLQRELFVVGAELATAKENSGKLKAEVSKVTPRMTEHLETLIDESVAASPLPDFFIVPGASTVSAAIDLARSIVRRGERYVVRMKSEGLLADDAVLHYLNRLSDLLFVLARREEAARGLSAPPSR